MPFIDQIRGRRALLGFRRLLAEPDGILLGQAIFVVANFDLSDAHRGACKPVRKAILRYVKRFPPVWLGA